MKLGWQPRTWLKKKAKRGMHGFPVGTIAFYGSDDRRATKVAVSVVSAPGAEAGDLQRWFAETGDVRTDEKVLAEVVTFLREREIRSVAMTDRIIGCPHEEGIDYPEGGTCPACPFWVGRNRWTGQLEEK
jgi:hypothetical protein